MKQIRILATALLLLSFGLTSCESYFEVKLDDQANLEEVFSKKSTTKQYLQNIYTYIPLDEEIIGSDGWVVPRSDEGMYSFTQWVQYLVYKTGNYSSATPSTSPGKTTYFDYWKKYYQGISQCSVFLANVDRDKEDTPEVIAYMKAEARFLRAFYYFALFRQYGPVFIWGDRPADEMINAKEVERMTVDQNVQFMVDELTAVAKILPLRPDDVGESSTSWAGRVTRGAALALKSRVLLYAASPLYNGCDLYKGKMLNSRGEYLFPQTKDDTKWQAAADAAWEVIQMGYSLCQNGKGDNDFQRAAASYQNVFFENWNSETIWGWWWRTSGGHYQGGLGYEGSTGYNYMGGAGGQLGPALPPNMGFETAFGGIAPSLKLIDTYPMWESGRYPITGYEKDAYGLDMSKPRIDSKSGYKAEGFTEGYVQPIDNTEGWMKPFKAHNSCVGRDPRFYASVVPNGFYFPNKANNKRFRCYNNAECESKWSAAGQCVRVGYAWRRVYKANTDLSKSAMLYDVKFVYPAFRLAEIYLNYAEACNEKPERDETAALTYLNKVRNRVGLNNIEVAYPEVTGNKELLRWCIQKERAVEFGMEAMRHYDACRWMVAKDEYPMAPWTLHLAATTYEESYQRSRTDFPGDPYKFTDRDYLFPISSNTQAEMVNMTQNYGF